MTETPKRIPVKGYLDENGKSVIIEYREVPAGGTTLKNEKLRLHGPTQQRERYKTGYGQPKDMLKADPKIVPEAAKRRKVIQLGGTGSFLTALCDDGTMFFSVPDHKDWLQLADVPQPKRKPCKKKQ